MDPCSSLLPRESSRNRAAKGIESARRPLFEPDAKRIEPARQWTRTGSSLVIPRLESTGLEATLDSKDSSPLGSCTTLLLGNRGALAHSRGVREPPIHIPLRAPETARPPCFLASQASRFLLPTHLPGTTFLHPHCHTGIQRR